MTNFPEIFIDPDFSYPEDIPNLKMQACSDGLQAWDLVIRANQLPPMNFGKGMIKIRKILSTELEGNRPDPSRLLALAKSYGSKYSEKISSI